MTLAYVLDGALYLNLTNRCTNDCVFCFRNDRYVFGGYDLRLPSEPTLAEMVAALPPDLAAYREIVFCGLGEPTENLDTLLALGQYLRDRTDTPLRLNTNGFGELSNGRPFAPALTFLTSVSISLNAPDAARYVELCRPTPGEAAYAAIRAFAAECRQYVPNVTCSVVGSALHHTEIEACRAWCAALGIHFRIR